MHSDLYLLLLSYRIGMGRRRGQLCEAPAEVLSVGAKLLVGMGWWIRDYLGLYTAAPFDCARDVDIRTAVSVHQCLYTKAHPPRGDRSEGLHVQIPTPNDVRRFANMDLDNI